MKHSSGFVKLVDETKTQIKEVTIDQVAGMQNTKEDFMLIDVREDSEWAAGHAQGALHMGRGIIERDIENTVPDKQTKLVLYCGGGYRSALAADSLQKMGYTNVWSLAGGWRAWSEKKLPVE